MEKSEFLAFFYKHCMQVLTAPIFAATATGKRPVQGMFMFSVQSCALHMSDSLQPVCYVDIGWFTWRKQTTSMRRKPTRILPIYPTKKLQASRNGFYFPTAKIISILPPEITSYDYKIEGIFEERIKEHCK